MRDFTFYDQSQTSKTSTGMPTLMDSSGRNCVTSCTWQACFPHLEPSRLNAWLSYPLALLGLKELDLSFHLRNPSDHRLPPQLFVSQSLEVLKLDSNLHLDAAEFSHISLPTLKLLHLHSFLIVQDDLITKLVSCCPSFEDLSVAYCLWNQGDGLAISSHSLRRLELIILKCDEIKNSGLVLIDTPCLQYLQYVDNLAFRYSITNMNDLVQADLAVEASLLNNPDQISLQVQLSLVRMLSNVHHLSLLDCFIETMYYGELGSNSQYARWDNVLLEILTSSPSLETLIFPQGFLDFINPRRDTTNPELVEIADLEDQTWKTSNVIRRCFQYSLKRIVIEKYVGIARELNIIKFLLRKASVLLELVVCLSPKAFGLPSDEHMLSESTLKELPRASSFSCSVRVLQPTIPAH
ncbi:F-box/LRR-repeat protein At4g14103-like [Silene latifolia]|uniref:F-box/LRR-repeat protein At4g14103-like n=1 Tax=Silene latifolia TaxID=37657 RepID=UPI003D7765E8